MVDPIPEYIRANPPEFQNPFGLCNLVLIVSIGYKDISTAIPAKAFLTNLLDKI